MLCSVGIFLQVWMCIVSLANASLRFQILMNLKTGDHHRLEDFARRGQEPSGEVQIYTWPDATLRELTDLIKEVQPDARKPTTKLSFALVYPDKKGRNVVRQVCI